MSAYDIALCISRKVKKSESKSQLIVLLPAIIICCVYPVKLKNLKANHNPNRDTSETRSSVFCSSQKEIHF